MALVLTAGSISTGASEAKYQSLESISGFNQSTYIYNNFELCYDYNGETVLLDKNDMTYEEFEVAMRVLSDEYLSFKDIKTEYAVEIIDELFPDKGYVDFLAEDDGNWIIGFDDNEVYARCIDPINKTFSQGFFEYKTATIYNAFRAFLDNLCDKKINGEVIPEPAPEKHENEINITDMKQIYEAHFPLGNFSDAFSWGICSYTREGETEPVTVAYITFKGMEFLRIITEKPIENNKFVFDTERVAYFENGNDGIEYDMNFSLTNRFEIQVNVNDKKQAEAVVMTYQNIMRPNAEIETDVIDMSTYEQNGYLPSHGDIAFSQNGNIPLNGETKNVTVLDEHGDDKVITVPVYDNSLSKDEKESDKSETGSFDNNEKSEHDETPSIDKAEKESNSDEEPFEDNEIKETDSGKEESKNADNLHTSFIDVPENHWAYAEITALAKQGIILGYGNGYFGTNDPVTHKQMSLLLDRLFDYKCENTDSTSAERRDIIVALIKAIEADLSNYDDTCILKFDDYESVSPACKPYIAYAIENKLVRGSNGRLNLDDNVSRAETAVFLYRAMNMHK